ncbi:hypothetical protein TWF481_002771 [Arthrobotrys musiformis]|uniref:Uncharacterized protein n=1 Tax=Arthrobotrys musiformis TaxID=47236 RepID=A0AAV9VT72_9PEZI
MSGNYIRIRKNRRSSLCSIPLTQISPQSDTGEQGNLEKPKYHNILPSLEQCELKPQTVQTVSSKLGGEVREVLKQAHTQTPISGSWLQHIPESAHGNPEEDAQSSIKVDDSAGSPIHSPENFGAVIDLTDVKRHTCKTDDAAGQSVDPLQGSEKMTDLTELRPDINEIDDAAKGAIYLPQGSDEVADLKGFDSDPIEIHGAGIGARSPVDQVHQTAIKIGKRKRGYDLTPGSADFGPSRPTKRIKRRNQEASLGTDLVVIKLPRGLVYLMST